MTIAFLYMYKESFIAYPYTQDDQYCYGARRTYQRFEQCIYLLKKNANPALIALEGQSLFDLQFQQSSTEMVKEVIKDYKNEISSQIHDKEVLAKLHAKLDAIKLWVMFPDEVLNLSIVSEAYKELELVGTETFAELFVGVARHKTKVENDFKGSWIRFLDEILNTQGDLVYDLEADLFCKSTWLFISGGQYEF